MDAYLGLPYRNYSGLLLKNQANNEAAREKQLKAKQDTINTKPATTLPLAAYAGTYKHNVYGNMTISVKEGKLLATFEHHQGRYAVVEPLGGNRFLATFNDPLYGIKVWSFTTGDKMVKSVTVKVADFVEFTPYEFYKVK